MLLYLAHKYQGDQTNMERVKKIAHDLQMENPTHCVVCPLLNFSCLDYGEIGYEQELEICLDLLSVCDYLIVASDVSKGVQKEIDFARMVGMEVIDLAEKYRSI